MSPASSNLAMRRPQHRASARLETTRRFDPTPTLSVTNASDPDQDVLTYDFHVSLASNYTTTVSLVTGLSTTSWSTGALVDDTRYYWRSRAVDSHGLAGPWSTASFFVNTSNDAPSAPTLSSPASGAESHQTPGL
jgi:hypothetical protein